MIRNLFVFLSRLSRSGWIALSCLLFITGCEEEKLVAKDDLAGLINQYRAEQGLAEIQRSVSLAKVADLHVKDLADNQPVKGNCNLHSWSDKGAWTSCCYTDDHAQAACMWNKPRELTDYPGDGYEIAAWSSINITAQEALSLWKESAGHNNVILNKDIWKDVEWKAMGAAMYKDYAVVWFGKETDPEKVDKEIF
jgi:hypothetical protein